MDRAAIITLISSYDREDENGEKKPVSAKLGTRLLERTAEVIEKGKKL